jgi:indole-3-glycerol phosphate synthase
MTILDRIVVDTRELVRSRKREIPVTRLEALSGFGRSTRPLEDALRGGGLAFIAEVKRASPSRGIIRADFRPVDIARRYEENGAAAISVVTEPLHFDGSLEVLSSVREAVSLPLLRKDFVIDFYQLYEARAHGADAVLLIAAVLDRNELSEMMHAARELDLSVLVEVYDLHELDRIDFDAVSILGVNNRDLRTFEVDIEHSIRVFARAPESVVRVSESGLGAPGELKHLLENGIDAVLIGETFMRADDPGQALAELRTAVAAVQKA